MYLQSKMMSSEPLPPPSPQPQPPPPPGGLQQLGALAPTLVSLVTIVGSVLSAYIFIDNRFDSASKEITTQIAQLDTKFTSQIAQLDTKFTSQIAQLDTKFTSQIAQLDMKSNVLLCMFGFLVLVAIALLMKASDAKQR